jgi:fucose 4-O-acetylase-like acetyltransferase
MLKNYSVYIKNIKKNNNHEEWVDNLKLFGIIFVILGHISSPPQAFIFTWHMPLFFIISGFFIDVNQKPQQFIVSNSKRLLMPYLVFTLLALFAETFKRLLLGREPIDYFSEFYNMYIWMDGESLINTYAFVLWFLPTLFFARLVVFSLCKYVNNIAGQFVTVSLLFALSFLLDLPFSLDNALNSALFVYIGFKAFFYYKKGSHHSFVVIYFFLSVLILATIYIIYGLPGLDMARKNYSNIPANIVWSCLTVFVLSVLLDHINFKSDLMRSWSKNTMFIFAIHPYTNNIGSIAVEYFLAEAWYISFGISVVILQILLYSKNKIEKKIKCMTI